MIGRDERVVGRGRSVVFVNLERNARDIRYQ